MNEQIATLPAEVAQIAENVSVEKRNEVQTVLNQVFNGVSKMREQLDSVSVENENDKVNMKLANTIRLGVRQVRLDAEKTFDAKRNEVQAQMLSYKTEDSLWLKAKQTMQILTKEIEENARWKEETKARFDAEQKELATQQRMIEVSKYAELSRIEFENMSDSTFESFVSGLKATHEAKLAEEKRIEDERIAKAKAEAEAIEAQRLENIRLKEEADKKEKELELERQATAKKLAEEKAKADAERKALEEKALEEKRIADAKLKAEREANEKLQAELKAKADAEAKAKKDGEDRLQAELKAKALAEKKAQSAPDKVKLLELSNQISSIQMPELKGEEAQKISADVAGLLQKICTFIGEKTSNL